MCPRDTTSVLLTKDTIPDCHCLQIRLIWAHLPQNTSDAKTLCVFLVLLKMCLISSGLQIVIRSLLSQAELVCLNSLQVKSTFKPKGDKLFWNIKVILLDNRKEIEGCIQRMPQNRKLNSCDCFSWGCKTYSSRKQLVWPTSWSTNMSSVPPAVKNEQVISSPCNDPVYSFRRVQSPAFVLLAGNSTAAFIQTVLHEWEIVEGATRSVWHIKQDPELIFVLHFSIFVVLPSCCAISTCQRFQSTHRRSLVFVFIRSALIIMLGPLGVVCMIWVIYCTYRLCGNILLRCNRKKWGHCWLLTVSKTCDMKKEETKVENLLDLV